MKANKKPYWMPIASFKSDAFDKQQAIAGACEFLLLLSIAIILLVLKK